MSEKIKFIRTKWDGSPEEVEGEFVDLGMFAEYKFVVYNSPTFPGDWYVCEFTSGASFGNYSPRRDWAISRAKKMLAQKKDVFEATVAEVIAKWGQKNGKKAAK